MKIMYLLFSFTVGGTERLVANICNQMENQNEEVHLYIINDLIDEIINKYKGKNILLVTHSGTARAIERYFYGIDENGDLPPENLKNCEIREYEIMEK